MVLSHAFRGRHERSHADPHGDAAGQHAAEGNDAHGANPHVYARMGMPEHLAWVYQRRDGGRGFGFTGGHWHWNWGCDSFRTVVLNGIVWTAGLEVPARRRALEDPTLEELEANQDKPQPRDFDRQAVLKKLRQ